jgi:hypothetical protein
MMSHVATPTEQVVNLIKAENQAGPNASAAASKILAPNFLGITRAKGTEEGRADYLKTVEDAAKPGSDNPLRWLDIANRNVAPDLAEPLRGQGGPMKNPNSGEWIFGNIAIVKAVVTTRKRDTPNQSDGRYRNIYVFAHEGEAQDAAWRLLAWQVTGNVKWGGPGTS